MIICFLKVNNVVNSLEFQLLVENFLSLFSAAKILSFSELEKVYDSEKIVFCSE